MKNKKNFNNLRDSICLSLFFVLYVCFTLIFIWFGVLNPSEGTNPTVGLIISITIFVPILVAIAWLIVSKCYEYWILTDDFISSKKMFKKEIVIYLAEIEKVEKIAVPALILGIYKSEAYIIYSNNKKIVILLNDRKLYPDLDYELSKFII